jgi:uncharacterized membrane protein YraQ (UPF0718 family)
VSTKIQATPGRAADIGISLPVFTPPAPPPASLPRRLALVAAAGLAWLLLYIGLPAVAGWITHELFGLPPTGHLSEAVEFFTYDAPKVFLLLVAVVYAVGIVHTFVTPERTRRLLAGRREAAGYPLAAALGVVTPFCSCSAVPLFIGFVTAGVPLGVTFTFLVAAPMVNEVALVLLLGLFGWKVASLYLVTGLAVATVAGTLIGRLHMEDSVEEWVFAARARPELPGRTPTWAERLGDAALSVRDVVGKIWLYLVAGIAVGALIHGYVPTDFMASFMGRSSWWAVPLAVLIGIPIYSNAAGVAPVVQALLAKGAALGTVLAFMMAVIGLSLPETILLRKVLKRRLIAVFIAVVATGILLVGYLFNAIL